MVGLFPIYVIYFFLPGYNNCFLVSWCLLLVLWYKVLYLTSGSVGIARPFSRAVGSCLNVRRPNQIALRKCRFLWREGKAENPEKNPSEQGETNNKLNLHETLSAEIEPRSQWWEASAYPLRHQFMLRRRNTGYKNSKLVAQHCCVSSFWSMFFTMRNQLVAQQKHLLRVEESCCSTRFSSNSQLVTQQICCDAAILDPH